MNDKYGVAPLGSVTNLLETVIQGGYCIGCGACAAVTNSPLKVTIDSIGRAQAVLDPSDSFELPVINPSRVCPFSDDAANEHVLASNLFPSGCPSEHLGPYVRNYAGFVREGTFRARGSSGGMGKWILAELLRVGEVDAVVQVIAMNPEPEGRLYKYQMITRQEDVLEGSKSVYYPVEMSDLIQSIRAMPGRYAVTGLPCFVKAIRLLQREDPVLRERIRFCVGIICGHMKTDRYAEMIGWQFGVEPGELSYIDFRKKLSGRKANEKGVEVRSRAHPERSFPPETVQNLFGTNYGHGFFQYKACDFCDDVVGETADISVGDAWLPEYMGDSGGNNIVVVRSAIIDGLIQVAIAEGRLSLVEVPEERAIESQAGGFRQRREGLAYRLWLTDRRGEWRPTKRVEARRSHVDRKRRRIYELRSLLSETSHEVYNAARQADSFERFRKPMQRLIDEYQLLYRPGFAMRLVKAIKRRLPARFLQ